MRYQVNVDTAELYILALRQSKFTGIFRVTFERRCKERPDRDIPGPIRVMKCRFWCKELQGRTRPEWTPGARRLVLVYDMEVRAPRFINLEGIMEIKSQGHHILTDHVVGTLKIKPAIYRSLAA